MIVTAAFETSGAFLLAGRIDNDLQSTAAHGLVLGEVIGFDPQHVLAIDRKP